MAIEEMRQVALDGDRALHLRRLGMGRPVVLLHESPRSSAVLLPLATRLAERFTVFALDTPGYGMSDPLAMHRPEITDFADAIARSLRALGLGRVPVYGTHTGATIGAELGRRHPDLVSGLVLDGYPVFTIEERDLHHAFYLKAFPPRWDGGHVVELWSRIRDQFDFFPWYLRGESARLALPKADLLRHRAVLRDFLLSGDHYASAYAASFRFDGREALQGQSVPVRIVARPTDLLFHQMQRLGDLPGDGTVSEIDADADPWAASIAGLFDAMPGDLNAPPPSDGPAFAPSGRLGTINGRMLVRGYGPGAPTGRAPVLLLHDTPGCAADLADLAALLGRERRVIVPDLPNHGRSVDTQAGREVEETIGLISSALDAAGSSGPSDIVGFGSGGELARLLPAAQPGRIARIVEMPQGFGDASGEPRLPPRMDGADLVERWFALRELCVFGPGAERRRLAVGIDVEAIHRRFAASILADGNDIRMAAAVRTRLASAPRAAEPDLVIVDPWARDAAARAKGDEPPVEGPAALSDRIGRLLDDRKE